MMHHHMSARTVFLAAAVIIVMCMHGWRAHAGGPTTKPESEKATISVLDFPAGELDIALKIERGAGLIFTRELAINGTAPGLFLIDTGANRSVLDASVVRELNLPRAMPPMVANRTLAVYDVEVLTLGRVSLRHHPLVAADLTGLRVGSGIPIRGILGDDVLGHCPFTIDYRNGTLTLHSPRDFKAPSHAERHPLQLVGLSTTESLFSDANPNAGQPVLQTSIGKSPARLLLDTACSSPLVLGYAFGSEHSDLVDKTRGRQESATAWSGPLAACPLAMTQLGVFGQSFPLRGEAVAIVGLRTVKVDADATLGNPILENFRLTFDLSTRQLWTQYQPMPTLQQLAESGNINRSDLAGTTLLMFAAKEGNSQAFQALVKAGARVEGADALGRTVLHYAAEGGSAPIVQRLLDSRGAAVDAPTARGATALMVAVKLADLAIAKKLVAAGADPSRSDRDGLTPLHYAARASNLSAVEWLVGLRVDLEASNAAGYTAVETAAGYANSKVFDYLVEHGAKLSARGSKHATLLHLAAENGNEVMILHLLKKHPDLAKINATSEPEGATPLLVAVTNGYPEAAEALLKAGADVNAAAEGLQGITPLHVAALYGRPKLVNLLLQRHPAMETRALGGATPLVLAAKSGNAAVLKLLLDAGAKIEAATDEGFTALAMAAAEGHTNMVQLLIESKANVNTRSKRGLTPLHLATMGGSVDVVRILLKAHADRNLRTDAGLTALDLARDTKHPALLRALSDSPDAP